MPFVVEEQRRGVNWFLMLGVLFAFGFLGLLTYYLFFAPTPFIESLIPARSQLIVEISKARFEPNDVLNDPTYQTLRQYTLPLEAGEIGRPNPFLPF